MLVARGDKANTQTHLAVTLLYVTNICTCLSSHQWRVSWVFRPLGPSCSLFLSSHTPPVNSPSTTQTWSTVAENEQLQISAAALTLHKQRLETMVTTHRSLTEASSLLGGEQYILTEERGGCSLKCFHIHLWKITHVCGLHLCIVG